MLPNLGNVLRNIARRKPLQMGQNRAVGQVGEPVIVQV